MKYSDLVKFEPKDVAKAAKAISGKFKVVRLEIPATKKSLRNIICGIIAGLQESLFDLHRREA